jgi:hypothetical protein
MTAHGINYIEKALLIAQRLGKLSGIIAAYRTAVRLGPMSETGRLTHRNFVSITLNRTKNINSAHSLLAHVFTQPRSIASF